MSFNLTPDARKIWTALSEFYTRKQLFDIEGGIAMVVRTVAKKKRLVRGSGAYENMRMTISSNCVERTYEHAVDCLNQFPRYPVPVWEPPMEAISQRTGYVSAE